MHLIYFNSDQIPVSVFLSTHSSKDIAASMKLRDLSGYTIAAINTAGVDLVVLTTLDESRTRQIAESIAGQIRQAAQESQTRGANDVELSSWSKTAARMDRGLESVPAFSARPL